MCVCIYKLVSDDGRLGGDVCYILVVVEHRRTRRQLGVNRLSSYRTRLVAAVFHSWPVSLLSATVTLMAGESTLSVEVMVADWRKCVIPGGAGRVRQWTAKLE